MLRWVDGFDWSSNSAEISSRYDATSSGVPGYTTSTAPRSSLRCLNFYNGFGGGLKKNVAISGGVVAGCGVKHSSTGYIADLTFLRIGEASTEHISVVWNVTTNRIEVWRGLVGTGTLLITSTTVCARDLWHFVEIKASISASAGSVELKINDVTDGTFSGVTSNGGSAIVQHVWGGLTSANGPVGSSFSVDDFYIADTSGSGVVDFLGQGFSVKTVFPDAAGDSTQWTANTGSANFQHVNDNNFAGSPDTYYVATSTPNAIDLYNVATPAGAAYSVKGVQVSNFSKKDDVGVRSVRNLIKSGSTVGTGATVALGTAYDCSADLFLTNPDTSAAWTAAEMASIQIGIENI